jgi:hypothetical protein
MRDLINLIEQLDEITVSSTDEFLDKIVNPDLAHVIYGVISDYIIITDDFKKPAILAFDSNLLQEISEIVVEIHDEVMESYGNERQIVRLTTFLYNYFINGETYNE